jgi:hypothetical protein
MRGLTLDIYLYYCAFVIIAMFLVAVVIELRKGNKS